MSNARDIADAGYKLIAFGKFNGGSDYNPATLGLSNESTFGITSIYDSGVGTYTITLNQTLDHNDYTVNVFGYRHSNYSDGNIFGPSCAVTAMGTTSFSFATYHHVPNAFSTFDPQFVCFSVFYKE